ncbi:hypothetical protein I4Q42_00075 [Caulobacter hibisci]|uniref:Uncharacterized protein n=2 Tax=Caulobacter hibisci TaxID=2035993 RepID=A0ABS0SRI3_9CAUL|nr:hypothetical protein [Caulobacter hibisci]
MVAGAAVVALAGLGIGGLATARQEREAPGVSLAQDVVAAASAFETYTRGAGEISPAAFTDGQGVAKALTAGSAYKAEQLEAGMIAYGAIAALQEPAFLDGVRRAAQATSREAVVERLLASPESVVEIEGVGLAAARAQVALQGRGAPLAVAGRAVKQSAYDIQRQTWSKGPIADNAGRLARVKQLSTAVFTPGRDDAGRLIQAATGAGGGGFAEGGAVFTPVTVRSAALAALAVLDAAGDADVARLAPVLSEKKTNFCMKIAKLNLYQCLAVAGPHYEDVFCLGQHALIDTAQCVNDAAGAGAVAPTAAPAPPPRPQGFVIPVASVSPAVMAEGSR